MAGYIRGITIEFGADTSKLNSALKKTQGTINKTQAELKAVNRALKFNPGNTTLLRQKFQLLQQTVQQTRGKLEQLKAMQRNMDARGVDKNTAAYRELEREIVKTESQLRYAEGQLKRFGSVGRQQVLAVGRAFQTAGGKIKSAGRTITTTMSVYGVAGIYAGKKLIDLNEKQVVAETKLAEVYRSRLGVGKKAVQSTLELAKAEQQLGIIGDEVQIAGAQQLATFAKYPSTINTILPAMNNLLAQQKGVNATQDDAVRLGNLFGKVMQGQTGALRRWGISFTEAQEKVLKYGTEEEKAAMLAKVVTENVGEMNQALTETKSGKIQQAKNLIGDLGEDIGAILLPAVADIAKWISTLLPKLQGVIDYMKQHPQIAKFALAIAGITAVLGPVIMFIGGLISAIGTIISIGPALGAAFSALAGPVGIAIAAIAAAIAIGVLLYKNWDKIKAWAKKTWDAIKKTITDRVNAIKTTVTAVFTAIKTKISNIWTAIKTKTAAVWASIKSKISDSITAAKKSVADKFSAMKQSISDKITGIKDKVSSTFSAIKDKITQPIQSAKDTVKGIIDKIKGLFPLHIGKIFSGLKLPHFSISGGKFPYGVGGKGSLPNWSVSWYKKAQRNPFMFSSPTLFGAGDGTQDEILYGRRALMRDIAQAAGGNGLNGVTVNVYGSDNMSVNDLAAAVEHRLITMQKRRTQAWA